MASYQYHSPSLVERIEVTSPRPHVLHAAIVMRDTASIRDIEKLREDLGANKLSTMMDTKDGHAVLQVRGLKSDEQTLLHVMEKLGFAHGGVEKHLNDADRKKESFRDRVRGKSLFLSSIFYDLGNLAFIISGIQRGRHNKGGKMTPNDKSEIMIGVAFSLGDVLMTFYAADKGDEELKAASKGIKRHLHSKGIEIPHGDALNPDTLHQSGALKAVDRWLHRNIVYIKCMTELAGGLFTIHSALKPGNRNNGKLAAGFMIAVAWLATLMLEKPRGETILEGRKENDNIFDKAKHNPRGWIARPLAIGNNISNLYGALGKNGECQRFKSDIASARSQVSISNTIENQAHLAYTLGKQHDFMYNVISACSFMVAHMLFGLSGTKHVRETDDDRAMMQDVFLLSANVLARQPEATREHAIATTAEYVSHFDHNTLKKEEIADIIRTKVMELSQSTWASRIQAETQKNQKGI